MSLLSNSAIQTTNLYPDTRSHGRENDLGVKNLKVSPKDKAGLFSKLRDGWEKTDNKTLSGLFAFYQLLTGGGVFLITVLFFCKR